MTETNLNLTREDNLLAYKVISRNYNTSFYFWTSLGLGVIAVFGTKFLSDSQILNEFLTYTLLTLAAVPLGLLFWRYVINRQDRQKLTQELTNRFNEGTNAEKLKALTSNFNKKLISTFYRTRHFVNLIAIIQAVIFIYRLNTDGEFNEVTYLNLIIASVGTSISLILTLAIQLLAKRDLRKFEEPEATEPSTAA